MREARAPATHSVQDRTRPRRGPSRPDAYAILIRGNRFHTNDLFVGASRPVNMAVRIEKNRFALTTKTPPTERRVRFWRLGAELEAAIRTGGNTFPGTAPR